MNRTIGLLVVLAGAGLVVVGLLIYSGALSWFGRLPGDIRYEGEDWVARAFTRINRCRRRFGIFYGDSGIFCRREIFDALGGYRPWPILEDYDFACRLRRAGKLALLDEPVCVSNRRWRQCGLFPTLWSWFWIQGLYLAGVSPQRLVALYRNVRSSRSAGNIVARA